jgi:hypothetical protein
MKALFGTAMKLIGVLLMVAMAFVSGFGHGYQKNEVIKNRIDVVLIRSNKVVPGAKELERWLGYPS